MSVNKEKHELQSRLEESDEEMSELMKKYKTAVQQVTFADSWWNVFERLASLFNF